MIGRTTATTVAAAVVAGCAMPRADAPAEEPFAWTVGEWHGTRTDAGSGESEPMTMRVVSILGGAGHARSLAVGAGDRPYLGHAIQAFDPDLELWVRYYCNSVYRHMTRLEAGDPSPAGPTVWRGASPGRTRDSRLVSERLADGRWRRTMSYSADGGRTWQPLWIDELRRR